ncbi:hypothetical protein KRX54_03965 [Actinomycetaceae bacterium TAE3-ERU4]|nr:hypothetical protein [Actinomycetaceae bacterium TAE3-ERU4]
MSNSENKPNEIQLDNIWQNLSAELDAIECIEPAEVPARIRSVLEKVERELENTRPNHG